MKRVFSIIVLVSFMILAAPSFGALRVWYNFEDDFTSGTLEDDSGNNVDGDCHLDPDQCPKIVVGPDASQAAHFEGSLCMYYSDYFYVPLSGEDWTEGAISVWVNYDAPDNWIFDAPEVDYSHQQIVDNHHYGVAYTWTMGKWGQNTKVSYLAPSTYIETELLSFAESTVYSEWHHYYFTWNATTAKAYYDGILVESVDKSSIPYLKMDNYLGIGCMTHGNPRDTETANCVNQYYATLDYYEENEYPGYEDPYSLTYVMPNADYLNGSLDNLYIYDNYMPTGGNILNVPAEYATIQAAVNAAEAGDYILIAPGSYDEAVTTAANGNSYSPITIDGENSSSVSVKGITINHDYITVKNIKFTKISTYDAGHYFVRFGNTASHSTVEDCVVEADNTIYAWGVAFDAVSSHPYGGDYPSDNTVTGCDISGVYHYPAIMLNGTNNIIDDCYVHDLYCEAFVRFQGWSNIVRNCTFYNNVYKSGAGHVDCFEGFGKVGSVGTYTCIANENHIIENNLVDLRGPDSSEQGAFFQVSAESSPYAGGWTFRNNIVLEPGGAGSLQMPNFKFYNNTFYNTMEYGQTGTNFISPGYDVTPAAESCTNAPAKEAADGTKLYNNVFLNGNPITGSLADNWGQYQAGFAQIDLDATGGAGDGTTLICSDLVDVESDNFYNGLTLTMDEGSCGGACSSESRTISGYTASTGTLTVSEAFSGQVQNGDGFKIYANKHLLQNCVADYNYVGKILDSVPYSAFSVDGEEDGIDDAGYNQYFWYEAHGINGGDPGFVSESQGCSIATSICNFNLTSTSILRGAGLNLYTAGLWLTDVNDYAGNARPESGAWDIGAYRYSPATGQSFAIGSGSQTIAIGGGSHTLTLQ